MPSASPSFFDLSSLFHAGENMAKRPIGRRSGNRKSLRGASVVTGIRFAEHRDRYPLRGAGVVTGTRFAERAS
ncbi:hypothetical protein B8V81_4427 [Paenibacillus pasadenensis]|uniref:Uncharacterized protein n=2 Tax=Paenibacillus TaxID=44249 RepID=A0A2N5N6L3_9BACL|nr:hypothetical protein B8V81_4427 [Paenibacillus pasadenensis]